MFGIGTQEMIVILVLALIVLGPRKLPEIARAIGKGLRELQKALHTPDEDEESPREENIPPATESLPPVTGKRPVPRFLPEDPPGGQPPESGSQPP